MIKVAIIGMGGMGKVHYAAYKEADNCKVVAVADVRKSMQLKVRMVIRLIFIPGWTRF